MQGISENSLGTLANRQILPWWKEPSMWLVVGGPVSVIVACIITGIVIWHSPESVVAEDYYQKGINVNKTLSEKPEDRTLAPAQQVRNHVMTPQVNKAGKQP